MLLAAYSVCALLGTTGCSKSKKGVIIVGAKMSTEEQILGEIVAQHLERRLGEPVERRFGYGGTLLTYENLQMGDIDVYPEYTSAILSTILRHAPEKDPSVVFERARSEVLRSAALQLLDPLGVDNGFVIITRAEFAKKRGVTKISDLEKIEDQWLLAVTPEFQQRVDGYQSLVTAYDLGRGSDLRIVDTSGLYTLLRDKKVDVIASHSTDGMLATGEFEILKDDRHAFGPAQACILVRQLAIDKNPNLRPALLELSGKLTNDIIRKLNYDVDVKGQSIRAVAAAFLSGAGPQTIDSR
jgi:glycine betaine/choline ABC-type transport system substrate-binding protein